MWEWTVSIADVYHKFDGVVNKDPKPKNFVGYVREFLAEIFTKSGKLSADLNQFMHYFSSNYLMFDHPNCVKDMVNRCELLHYQLRKIYFLDARSNYTYVEKDSRREVCERILFRMSISVQSHWNQILNVAPQLWLFRIWQHRVEGRLRLTFILLNMYEHGVPHSANEITRNIWQFGILSRWYLPWEDNLVAIFFLT